MITRSLMCFLLLVAATLASCKEDEPSATPLGFPPLPVPADNIPTTSRVELGRRLFYDARLSRTEEVSCASCHRQQNAFADPRRLSVGVHGRLGERNSPPLFNLAYNTSFFWEGGALRPPDPYR
jgi:cytochrome c peroxidase